MHRFLVIQERRSGSQVLSFVGKTIITFCPVHCAGVEGDSATQSSDGTDQENYQHEEQAGWGEEEQNSSGSSEAGEGDSSKEGQDIEEGRVVSYLGDSFGSSGMGDLSGGVLEEGELARGMEKKGIYRLPIYHILENTTTEQSNLRDLGPL